MFDDHIPHPRGTSEYDRNELRKRKRMAKQTNSCRTRRQQTGIAKITQQDMDEQSIDSGLLEGD